MTKQQKQQFDNLYNFSNNGINQKNEDKNEKKKADNTQPAKAVVKEDNGYQQMSLFGMAGF